MEPANRELKFVAGATFRKRLTLYPDGTDGEPQDWTGYSARFVVLNKKTDPEEESLLELTSEPDEGITLDADGHIDIRIEEDVTEALRGEDGAYYFLEVITPGGSDTDALLVGALRVVVG